MNKEIRSITVEMRADSEGRTVEGYAALTDVMADLGWYREKIMPGAFDNADISDVRALFNHDSNFLLARSKSNTLTVTVDEKGLYYRFDMPETPMGDNILAMIRRGDLTQSSFAFTVSKTSWRWESDNDDLDKDERTIEAIDVVYDVAPVTFPAYEDTSVSARSAEKAWASAKADHASATEKRNEPPEPTDFQRGVQYLSNSLNSTAASRP